MRSALAILVAATVTAAAAAQEGTRPEVPTITVRGEASATVVPDTVVAVFGVVTVRPSATDATAINSKATADAIAAVEAEGVAAADIATLNAGLTPEMSPPDKSPPKIVGYRADNHLRVRFHDPDRAGAILGRLIDKGVNDVESITAVVSDDSVRRNSLRAEAAMDARRQADTYAGALGLTLGTVTRIEPEGPVGIPPMVMARKFAAAPAPVPIETGQQTITEGVRVTFTLLQQ